MVVVRGVLVLSSGIWNTSAWDEVMQAPAVNTLHWEPGGGASVMAARVQATALWFD